MRRIFGHIGICVDLSLFYPFFSSNQGFSLFLAGFFPPFYLIGNNHLFSWSSFLHIFHQFSTIVEHLELGKGWDETIFFYHGWLRHRRGIVSDSISASLTVYLVLQIPARLIDRRETRSYTWIPKKAGPETNRNNYYI